MPTDHRQRRHTLWLLCALSFILYVDRVNLATAAGAIKAELGLSNTELGVAFSAFAYSYAICQIGGGWIADRFGARITLIGCGLIWVVSTFATGLVHSLGLLFAARLLLGIGEGATLPAQARAITQWFPRERRGVVQGFTHSFSRLGNAVTPPIVAALMTWLSWRAAFFVIGAVTLAWLAWWIAGFREHPLGDDDGRTRTRRPAALSGPTPWGPLLRRMAPTIFVYFCYGWTAWLFFTWLPTFFLNGQGLNLKSTALFASGVFFAGVVGDTLGGWLCDRIYRKTGNLALSRQSVIVTSFVGALACLLPLAFVHSTAGVALCLSGSFLCLELTIGPIWAVPSDIAPAHAGIASGMMNAGSAISGILSPILFGYLVDRTGSWTVPFIGSVAMLLFGIVAALRIRPDRALSDSMPALADAPAAPSAH
ncbi:MFS transporter [Burkholderia sp. MSMB1072]|uniref:MFS transporter n=1 Tax=unclassified Burkholderia TaxID=2613784 RepID=UPI000753ACA6|nr:MULTISPECIES: MFS transporter [unclassified Burkholderia]KVH58681.1 MFS transporter [Burkholderia sp. MSMB1072]KVT14828.1 MFS transporter [Burkholderia sp. MSMB1078WGS]KWO47784.1 MFS transporter [Burkholderia sp. MSMB1459WGS]